MAVHDLSELREDDDDIAFCQTFVKSADVDVGGVLNRNQKWAVDI